MTTSYAPLAWIMNSSKFRRLSSSSGFGGVGPAASGVLVAATSVVIWLEPVAPAHIEGLKIIPDVPNRRVKVSARVEGAAGKHQLRIRVAEEHAGPPVGGTPGKEVGNQTSDRLAEAQTIPIRDPKLWSPETPYLYDLRVQLLDGNQVVAPPLGQRTMKSNVTAGFLGLAVESPQQLTSRALLRLINYLQANSLSAREYLFAFSSRIARTVAILFSVLLAIPFVLGSLRSAGAVVRASSAFSAR